MRHITLIIAVIALALAAPAFSGKGGNAGGNGNGNGNGNNEGGNGTSGGGGSRYSGTLTATPNVLHAGDSFDVSGCGYDTSLGNVIVGFTGGSWGSACRARQAASPSPAFPRCLATHFRRAHMRSLPISTSTAG